MDNKLKLITKTTSGYKADVHYYTDEGHGYFFGFFKDAAGLFNIPMVWFKDGTVFWDDCYGDQHLDLTAYHEAQLAYSVMKEAARKLMDASVAQVINQEYLDLYNDYLTKHDKYVKAIETTEGVV